MESKHNELVRKKLHEEFYSWMQANLYGMVQGFVTQGDLKYDTIKIDQMVKEHIVPIWPCTIEQLIDKANSYVYTWGIPHIGFLLTPTQCTHLYGMLQKWMAASCY